MATTLGFMFIDPMYFLFVGPALLLAFWAQMKVKSTYAQAQRIPSAGGMTGAQAAAQILQTYGCHDVEIEQTHGMLSDHYDPRQRVLRLSEAVYQGRDLAAVGIAAHEAGHALQHHQGYAMLSLRNAMVPLAITGSWLSNILFFGGMMLMMFAGASDPTFGRQLMLGGLIAFGATVVFQLINLPVEFDASARAKRVLVEVGVVREDQMAPVAAVLSAAAWTYVAATLAALLQMLYWAWRLGLLSGRRD